jgi:hypothetical protein
MAFWPQNPEEIDHLEDIRVDWRIILKWIENKLVGRVEWINLKNLGAVGNILIRTSGSVQNYGSVD